MQAQCLKGLGRTLTATLLLLTLLGGWSFFDTITAYAEERDITPNITWSELAFSYLEGAWPQKIKDKDGFNYVSGMFLQFDFCWQVNGEGYAVGDYFQFTLPAAFAAAFGAAPPVLRSSDGLTVVGEMSLVNEDKATNTCLVQATFLAGAESEGKASLGFTYQPDREELVSWRFELNGNADGYVGYSRTAGYRPTASLSLYGQYAPPDNFWCVTLNQPLDKLRIALTLTDTFQPGYTLDAPPTEDHKDFLWPQGLMLCQVDWDAIRVKLGLPDGMTSAAAEDMIWEKDDSGQYKYLSALPTESVDDIRVDDDGFSLTFSKTALNATCVRIMFWYELDDSEPARIMNSASFNGVSLDAVVNIPPPTPAPTPAELILTGSLSMSGAALKAGLFNFVICDPNGVQLASGVNDARGGISFPPIVFAQAGDYTCIVTAVPTNQSGYSCDTRACTILVTVREHAGQLVASVQYPQGGLAFAHSYTAPMPPPPPPATPGPNNNAATNDDGAAPVTINTSAMPLAAASPIAAPEPPQQPVMAYAQLNEAALPLGDLPQTGAGDRRLPLLLAITGLTLLILAKTPHAAIPPRQKHR